MKCQYCRKQAETIVNEVPVCKKHFFNARNVVSQFEKAVESMINEEIAQGKKVSLD